ncbi:MAG: ribonuclease HII [Candidatus Nanoarchaeia archaeon]|nr:ribonuclease HII [Candidatus Nanoarchaeia archaeon]
MMILGIDEAGRGPVIGPLVIAGTMTDENDLEKLKELGVRDSKLVLPKKRAELFKKLKKITVSHTIVINPKEIDEAVESANLNLNWLEAIKAAEIINIMNPDKVILDCPSPNLKAYERYLRKHLQNKEIPIICEHKADLNYVIVGAASILAKETREIILEKMKKEYGDFGPGYSSNAITQKYTEENFEKYPEIFRKSWATWKNQENNKKQKKLNEF